MLTRFLALSAVVVATTLPAAAQPSQSSTNLSGTVIDLGTFVTKDHNMDAMKGQGGAMSGDHEKAMANDKGAKATSNPKSTAMKGDHMTGTTCPALLGIKTSNGRAYPLTWQEGSSTKATLCMDLNQTVTLRGQMYSQAGVTVFLVNGVQ